MWGKGRCKRSCKSRILVCLKLLVRDSDDLLHPDYLTGERTVQRNSFHAVPGWKQSQVLCDVGRSLGSLSVDHFQDAVFLLAAVASPIGLDSSILLPQAPLWPYTSSFFPTSSSGFSPYEPLPTLSFLLSLADSKYNSCDIPEETWTGCESEVAYATYIPGSIIWAKQYGYPW